ncbi:MAG: sugar phosphate nucleotidyltransferase [Chitinophagales bacterium]|nr:sugar phosphate nucleotidyltransferase [Chitinophagales bacterium]MDW8427805.1 sugar phosphate nucleotidyltransferase [Chitinophagales bacterium]
MRVIVPMAGQGKRMRPHTLTTPKPMIPVAGKPIVRHLIEYLASITHQRLEHIAFVVGDFGKDTEAELLRMAHNLGATASIHYQKEPLGTAHAILCAAEHLYGPVLIAFADTLFFADFSIPPEADGVIWVKQVEHWQQFGVVKVNKEGLILEFVEKSPVYVSDLAIIGIYYFRDGDNLRRELQYLLDHDIKDKGEYQLTTAMEHMKNKGSKLYAGAVHQWLDCGNKDATVATNRALLERYKDQPLIDPTAVIEQSVIVPPCYLGAGVRIRHAVVGPYVSVGEKTIIESSVISNSIIQSSVRIRDRIISNSMLGNHVVVQGGPDDLSLGDYAVQR